MGARREHHASDIYPAWKKAITDANDSVVVFTPYFDALIVRLLAHATVHVTVVTDLSPESGAQDYLGQLRAIKKLLDDDIEVRHLDRLHAKVLWVDDGTVVYGSQNFTRYARKSKEASTSPAADLTGTPFTDTLVDWLIESRLVDEQFIDALLDHIAAPAKELLAATKALHGAYEQTLADYEQERQRRKEIAERAARAQLTAAQFANMTWSVRQPQGTAHLRKTYKDDAWYRPYASMVANNSEDLTKWIATDPDGSRRSVVLERAHMYPALFTDTGQMAFLRVMKTCITYVRFAVTLRDHFTLQAPSGQEFTASLSLKFPKIEDTGSNLRLIFKVTQYGVPLPSIEVLANFSGDDFVIDSITTMYGKNDPGPDPREPEFQLSIERENTVGDLFRTPEQRRTFFRRHLSRFTYKTLGIEDKNVNDVFTEEHYELAVTEYARAPVILAHHDPLGWFW